jgi:hypothetical protein
MKSLRYLIAAFAAVCLLSAAFAGDPSGTWKWTMTMGGGRPPGGPPPGGAPDGGAPPPGGDGSQRPPPPDGGGGGGGGGKRGPRESTLTLTLTNGQLAGTISGRGGDTPIGNATFKDDAVSFTVEREMQGNKVVTTYNGKLSGDTITGTIELPGRDGGEPRKLDWTATRSK